MGRRYQIWVNTKRWSGWQVINNSMQSWWLKHKAIPCGVWLVQVQCVAHERKFSTWRYQKPRTSTIILLYNGQTKHWCKVLIDKYLMVTFERATTGLSNTPSGISANVAFLLLQVMASDAFCICTACPPWPWFAWVVHLTGGAFSKMISAECQQSKWRDNYLDPHLLPWTSHN